MAIDYEDVIVLNEGLEQRTSKSGKSRFTIKITAEPIAVNLSKEALGGPVAAAIAHHFRERVKNISAVAAPATLKAREAAQRAFKAGKPWAMKLFAGGKTGAMEPNQSDRLFNDSGRFAKTIVAGADSKGNWRVNVAANRLSGDTAMVQRIWNRLVQLVPEFGNPSLLLESDIIRASLKKANDEMIKKGRATTGKMGVAVARGLFKIAQQVGDILAG